MPRALAQPQWGAGWLSSKRCPPGAAETPAHLQELNKGQGPSSSLCPPPPPGRGEGAWAGGGPQTDGCDETDEPFIQARHCCGGRAGVGQRPWKQRAAKAPAARGRRVGGTGTAGSGWGQLPQELPGTGPAAPSPAVLLSSPTGFVRLHRAGGAGSPVWETPTHRGRGSPAGGLACNPLLSAGQPCCIHGTVARSPQPHGEAGAQAQGAGLQPAAARWRGSAQRAMLQALAPAMASSA